MLPTVDKDISKESVSIIERVSSEDFYPSDQANKLEKQSSIQSIHIFRESDAGDGTSKEDHYLQGSQLILCFFALSSALFLFSLDQTIIATILTTVGSKFNSFEEIGWLSSAFMLGMAVFIQPFGKLSIILGRKWTMVVAILIFQGGSLMCALANSMNVLIGGRVMAGIGGAGVNSGVFVIVSEVVPINKRPMALSLLGIIFAIASVLGPLIGGAFTSNVTWRWAFYLNLPIGGVSLAVFIFTFHPPKPKVNIKQELLRFDYLGTFLLISGWVVFLLALTFGTSEFAWNSSAVISCFVIGPVLLIAFGIWNFGFSKNQILATEVIVIPQVLASVVSLSGIFAAYIMIMIYGSIYFQLIKDSSPLGAGLHLLPLVISVSVSILFTGLMTQRLKYLKPYIIVAGVCGVVGCALLTLLEVDSNFGQEIGLFILVGVLMGLTMPPSLLTAQVKAPKTPSGMINTTVFMNFLRSILSAFGAILGDAVYSVSLKKRYKYAIKGLNNPQIIQELEKFDIKHLISSTAEIKSLSPDTQHFVKTQIMYAIRNVFYTTIGFAAISCIAGVFVTNKKLPEEVEIKPKNLEPENKKVQDLSKNEIMVVSEELDTASLDQLEPIQSPQKVKKKVHRDIVEERMLYLLTIGKR